MKNLFKLNLFQWLLYILSLLLILKIVWFVVEVMWLPVKGVDQLTQKKVKALYYRVKLTSKKPPKPINTKVKKKSVIKISGNIKDIKLLAIYHSSSVSIVTVEYKRKTSVLSKGEEIDGFVLEDATNDFVLFSKNSKTYKLFLEKMNNKVNNKNFIRPTKRKVQSRKKVKRKEGKVQKIDNTHRIIDRSLVENYSKNIKAIEKDIGMADVKRNGQLVGFRVTFVRRGSDFSKLGLRRGDIITSVNGEEMSSYGVALGLYKNIKTIENLTFTIKRGKKEMELEYEIN